MSSTKATPTTAISATPKSRVRRSEYRPLTPAERIAQQERAALRRLQDILQPDRRWPFWSAHQASWYFIGIDPDASTWSDGPEASLFARLPGAPKNSSLSPHIHEMHLEDWHAKVSELIQGQPQLPEAWIRDWLAKGLRPVWLDAALADPICRSLLPDDLVRKCGVQPDGTKRQVAAANARYSRDEVHNTIMEHKDDFLIWFRNQTGRGPLKHGAIEEWCKSISHMMSAKYGLDVEIRRLRDWTVRWRKELEPS